MLSSPPLHRTRLHRTSRLNALAEVVVKLVALISLDDVDGDSRTLPDLALELAASDNVHVLALLDGLRVDGHLLDVEEAVRGVEAAAGVEVDRGGAGGFGGVDEGRGEVGQGRGDIGDEGGGR